MQTDRAISIEEENRLRWARTGVPNSGRKRFWVDYTCEGCRKPKRRHTSNRDRINYSGTRCLPCRRKLA